MGEKRVQGAREGIVITQAGRKGGRPLNNKNDNHRPAKNRSAAQKKYPRITASRHICRSIEEGGKKRARRAIQEKLRAKPTVHAKEGGKGRTNSKMLKDHGEKSRKKSVRINLPTPPSTKNGGGDHVMKKGGILSQKGNQKIADKTTIDGCPRRPRLMTRGQ